ncbi:MAG: hypothetical protein ACFBQW_09265, partial [Sphingomonadaceae bacterium]
MMIIAVLLAAAQAQGAPPPEPTEAERVRACAGMVAERPAQAVAYAHGWRQGGGAVPASLCLALAHAALEQWLEAGAAFEAAAVEAA